MAMKLAVLRGGRSAEREVSLRSGAQVEEALRGLGHEVLGVDIDATTWDTLRDGGFACVFNALHGRLGEDGAVQGMLELLGLPYTGSGILASALCMDKSRANSVMAGAGLHIPDFEELEIKEGVGADVVERLVSRFGLPIVVKPVREGSTIGLTIAKDADEAASGLALAVDIATPAIAIAMPAASNAMTLTTNAPTRTVFAPWPKADSKVSFE